MAFNFQVPGDNDILSQFGIQGGRGGVQGRPVGRPQGAQTVNPFQQFSTRSGGSAGGTLVNRLGIGGTGDPNSTRLLQLENKNALLIRQAQGAKSRVDAVVERVGRIGAMMNAMSMINQLGDVTSGDAARASAALRGIAGGAFATSFDVGTFMQHSKFSPRTNRVGSAVVGAGFAAFAGLMAVDQVIQSFQAGVQLKQTDLAMREGIANLAGSADSAEFFTRDIIREAQERSGGFATGVSTFRQMQDSLFSKFEVLGPAGNAYSTFLRGANERIANLALYVTGNSSVRDNQIKIIERRSKEFAPILKGLIGDPVLLASVVDPTTMKRMHENKDPRERFAIAKFLVGQLYTDSMTVDDRFKKLGKFSEELKAYKDNLKDDLQLFMRKQQRFSSTGNLSDRTGYQFIVGQQ